MNYRKYTWIGNRVSSEDMGKLHQIKLQTGKRITEQVAEAIKVYLIHHETLQNQRRGVKIGEPIS